MKRSNLILTLTALITLSSAVLSGCAVTTANASEIHEDAVHHQDQTSSDRLHDILERGYIEIATEPSFAPSEFIHPDRTGDDKYIGADIELASYIADSLDVELRLKPMDFTSVLGSITSGKYDLAISALAYTPERAETISLSKGYYYGGIDPSKSYGVLIRKEDASKIKGKDELSSCTVVSQNGSIEDQMVRSQLKNCKKMLQVTSASDAFLMVSSGRADAASASIPMAELYLESNPDCGLMILPDFYFEADESAAGMRIGIPKGEDALTERVNEIIDEVTDQGLYLKWYDEYEAIARDLGFEI